MTPQDQDPAPPAFAGRPGSCFSFCPPQRGSVAVERSGCRRQPRLADPAARGGERTCCKTPVPCHCEAPKGLWQSVPLSPSVRLLPAAASLLPLPLAVSPACLRRLHCFCPSACRQPGMPPAGRFLCRQRKRRKKPPKGTYSEAVPFGIPPRRPRGDPLRRFPPLDPPSTDGELTGDGR